MMKVEVVLEALDRDRYRASVSHPFELSAEAETREATLTALKEQLDAKLKQVEVLELDVGCPTDQPWTSLIGTWKDHPDMAEVLENMREYRRQVNADPNRL
jgi:predicted RNase H-like HicB family nuclease